MQIVQFHQLNRWKLTTLLSKTVALGVTASILLFATDAHAAEQVILKYGRFQGSVSVQELSQFVKIGKTTPTLKTYLQTAKQDPAIARQALTAGLKAEPDYVDSVLSSWAGPILVSQVGEVFHPPGGELDRQGLRTAVTKSVSGDGEVTLLEAISHYPEDSIALEGDRLIPVYERLSSLAKIF
ncbi:alpha/beta hydrolase [Nostoc sp. FACHB-152]|uniref:alpha/beta hydrolase n=1 Tax=unclassified Nostoc TaxID=2593658 RepID=UPI0016889AB8|nr:MULTISPECIES: alpha/beta hydrolase [unclassified Nostoc]MBD2449295.1 alpha/beta hydrolase [Nostoc sp. FACHB-152]MBD2470427.1 alpha/beta hydrolase [Nostoc sp. FACHB-145]